MTEPSNPHRSQTLRREAAYYVDNTFKQLSENLQNLRDSALATKSEVGMISLIQMILIPAEIVIQGLVGRLKEEAFEPDAPKSTRLIER